MYRNCCAEKSLQSLGLLLLELFGIFAESAVWLLRDSELHWTHVSHAQNDLLLIHLSELAVLVIKKSISPLSYHHLCCNQA